MYYILEDYHGMTQREQVLCGIFIVTVIACAVVVWAVYTMLSTSHMSRGIVFSNEWKLMPAVNVRPNRIYLSYISSRHVPSHIWDQYAQYAHGYTIDFFDDVQCLKSIQSFGDKVVRCYQSLSHGAHRCDLWRYCMLYRTGGVYLDIKTILTRPVSEMFPKTDCMYTVLGINKGAIHQGVIAVPPEHPIIADAITNMIHNPPGRFCYLRACKQLYHLIENYSGQTPRLGIHTCPAGPVELYQEHETHDCNQRDQHGYCRLDVLIASGEQMCIIRDPAFPYKQQKGTCVPSWISLPK